MRSISSSSAGAWPCRARSSFRTVSGFSMTLQTSSHARGSLEVQEATTHSANQRRPALGRWLLWDQPLRCPSLSGGLADIADMRRRTRACVSRCGTEGVPRALGSRARQSSRRSARRGGTLRRRDDDGGSGHTPYSPGPSRRESATAGPGAPCARASDRRSPVQLRMI